MSNSFHLATAETDAGVVFWKNVQDLWWYHQDSTEGPEVVSFGNCDGSWHHFEVIFTTSTNRYDLLMDGSLVADDILWNRDGSTGIIGVGFNSGRWGRADDVPSYFDDLSVYVSGG